ncbi:hypothetical protein [Kitasatospora azatica]|uniref:hypothetical protein n=1 Tax=Kitasatospora azatica TaxID=58347 RepID=UPI00055CA549|nr:hypothetical protein [Kitasatospora azatica]
MSQPLTDEQHTAIRALLGDVKPASDDLITALAESVQDRRSHDHPTGNEDWFCNNMSGWAGDRVAVVLRRLLDTEAERDRLRAELAECTQLLVDESSERERTQAERAQARAERDQFANRVDTLTAVAKSNQRAHRILAEGCTAGAGSGGLLLVDPPPTPRTDGPSDALHTATDAI